MHEQAFETLGIAPTTDGRVIRAAFVRLARIYHPDRFSGMPEDVRAEAERRMKDATLAYETLREVRKPPKAAALPDSISDAELKERAKHYRELMETNKKTEERDRAKWRRWEELERAAREKQEINAQIEAMIRNEGASAKPAPQNAPPPAPPAKASGSRLEERLDAARRGSSAPLARNAEAD